MTGLARIISDELYYGTLPYVEKPVNVQRFSDVVNAAGLAGYQGDKWCATYQFALELEAFGKAAALRHWHMTGDYCGYSCGDTWRKFEAAGATGSTPRIGALIIFNRSHMGRVLAINGSTITSGEGNTSNREFDRDGDACAVKTYAYNDPGIKGYCYIDYKEEPEKMTPDRHIELCKKVTDMGRAGGWVHGDSHSMPPCIGDKKLACDRMDAFAYYLAGYTDQQQGGFTVITCEQWYLKHGAIKITDPAQVRRGDSVLMSNGTKTPNAAWHLFVVSEFRNVNDIDKFDCGSTARIQSAQPFRHVPLNEWPGHKYFYAAFRMPEDDVYYYNPIVLKAGTKDPTAYSTSEILKARGFKGILDKSTGKRKTLALNHEWSIGDMAAMIDYKLQRTINGVNLAKGPYGGGEVGPVDQDDLLGIARTSRGYPLRTLKKGMIGNDVLFWQEKLRARGILGADGQQIGLDRIFGVNCEHATKQFQKASGLPETGIVDHETWRSSNGNR